MVSYTTSTTTIELYLEDVFTAYSAPEVATGLISQEIWQSWFQTWIESLSGTTPSVSACELSLRLTDDNEIQALNAQYRQKKQPTDVLAFAALEVNCPAPTEGMTAFEPLYWGDIIISVETARRQAQQNDHSLTVELAWLAAHGLLHLLGWDHPDEDSLQAMLSQQETLLNLVGLLAKS